MEIYETSTEPKRARNLSNELFTKILCYEVKTIFEDALILRRCTMLKRSQPSFHL